MKNKKRTKQIKKHTNGHSRKSFILKLWIVARIQKFKSQPFGDAPIVVGFRCHQGLTVFLAYLVRGVAKATPHHRFVHSCACTLGQMHLMDQTKTTSLRQGGRTCYYNYFICFLYLRFLIYQKVIQKGHAHNCSKNPSFL